MLFGSSCGCCNASGPSPCPRCIADLRPVGAVAAPGLDHCVALIEYDDAARALISQVKTRGVRTALAWFAAGLAALVEHHHQTPQLVTWIPATPSRRRRRGFDQGEQLARRIGALLGVRSSATLTRFGHVPQTGLGRRERLSGPGLAPAGGPVAGHVLVVDDVMTTGASLGQAAAAVRSLGATRVGGAVGALRPPPHG